VLPGDVLTERGASLPCSCDARTPLHEMLADSQAQGTKPIVLGERASPAPEQRHPLYRLGR